MNLLQEAGAVWLEKRRGFPYDYTVLLVNRSHEDVLAAMETVPGAQPADDAGEDYDRGDYDDDAFEDDYDHEEEEEDAEEDGKA